MVWFAGDVSVVRGVARTKLLDLYHDDVIGLDNSFQNS